MKNKNTYCLTIEILIITSLSFLLNQNLKGALMNTQTIQSRIFISENSVDNLRIPVLNLGASMFWYGFKLYFLHRTKKQCVTFKYPPQVKTPQYRKI